MIRIYSRGKNSQKFSLSLAALAFADLIVLIVGCLREYLDDMFNLSIRSHSNFSCKMIIFTCYLFSCFSAYLHGYIAIERWMAISDPIKAKARLTFGSNKIALVFILFICMLFNLPLIWFPSLKQAVQLDETSALGVKTVNECQVSHDIILFLIDSVFYCLIPFLITILFSTLALIKLIQSKSIFKNRGLDRRTSLTLNEHNKQGITNNRRSVSTNSNISRSESKHFFKINFLSRNSDINIKKSFFVLGNKDEEIKLQNERKIGNNKEIISPETTNITRNATKLNGSTITNGKNSPYKQQMEIFESHAISRKQSSNLKMTVMLLALPISYLITTSPIFVIIVKSLFTLRFDLNTNINVATALSFSEAYQIGKVCMYISNSINILFYILFGKTLRKDFWSVLSLKQLIICCKRKRTEIRNENDFDTFYSSNNPKISRSAKSEFNYCKKKNMTMNNDRDSSILPTGKH